MWAERIEALAPYQVNTELMAKAKPTAVFMHCLPAYHDHKTAVGKEMGEKFGRDAMEVTDEVFTGPQSIVFQEAENRMHTIKAVMAATLGAEVLSGVEPSTSIRAIPHNSKCRYGERGAAAARPKAQIILDAAKVSAASGGNSEPKQGQRSQSARGFCPRSTMRVPQPDIIEHFGNADAVPQLPERCLSRKAGIVRCCLR